MAQDLTIADLTDEQLYLRLRCIAMGLMKPTTHDVPFVTHPMWPEFATKVQEDVARNSAIGNANYRYDKSREMERRKKRMANAQV